ncbi:CatB-related O-acetyltransferase [Paenibacillus sp. FSL P4-0338]|uniref:CatB-related O-acetyltransferase n=1 Tax=Paenibacillus sp. FSL P4-0338 TaxID=2921635 RepID=UPI0030F8DAD5
MIANILVSPNQLRTGTLFKWADENNEYLKGFPVMYVDKFSYISNATVRTGVGEPGFANDSYAVHVGAFCSIARFLTIGINENHDYLNITTGVCDLISYPEMKIKTKGSVIIQNDVWIGQSCTILGGVTIHNGAVIASNSVVTKDVPPYSIVGGNPAQVIKYRFNHETIKKLLEIQWWNWGNDTLAERRKWFEADILDFVDEFYPDALSKKPSYEVALPDCEIKYVFFPDFNESFCIWEKVILEFCKTFKNSSNTCLVIFIEDQQEPIEQLNMISELVQGIIADCQIYIHCGNSQDEKVIFQYVSHYITSRSQKTIFRTCLADINRVKTISGVDIPIFS